MKVMVEVLTGTLFPVDLENDATVADLKREIGAQQKLPRDRLILTPGNNGGAHLRLFNGSDDDEATVSLADCGVGDGSHMYLFLTPLDDHGLGSAHHSGFVWPAAETKALKYSS